MTRFNGISKSIVSKSLSLFLLIFIGSASAKTLSELEAAEKRGEYYMMNFNAGLAFTRIEGNKFIGYYGHNLKSRLEGKVEVNVLNLEGNHKLIIRGKWLENSGSPCSKMYGKYPRWGSFYYDLSRPNIMRTVACAEEINPRTAKGMIAIMPGKPVLGSWQSKLREFFYAQAKTEIEKAKKVYANNQKTETKELKSIRVVDKINALEHWNYDLSRKLFSHGKSDFYIGFQATNSGPKMLLSVVAIHDIPDTKKLLDAIEWDKPRGWWDSGFNISEAELNKYRVTILPKVENFLTEAMKVEGLQMVAGGLNRISISHFTSNKTLADVSKKHKGLAIRSIIETEFSKEKGVWQLSKSEEYNGQHYAGLLNEQGLSFQDAYESRKSKRAQEAEERRRSKLTQQQRSREDIDKLVKNDNEFARLAERKGFITRDWLYWEQYANGEFYKLIFNGKAGNDPWPGVFPHLYLRFFGEYYRVCKSQVPTGSPGVDYYTDRTISNGYFSDTIRRYDGSIKVKARYWPMFKKYHENPPTGGIKLAINNSFGNRDAGQLYRTIEDAKKLKKFYSEFSEDSEKMFKNEACNSGFIKQLEENFYRAASNLQPIQKDTGKLSYRLGDNGGRNSSSELYKACIIYKGPRYNGDWCRCIDKSFDGVFSKSEYSYYIKNYPELVKKATETAGKLYNARSQCVGTR